MYDNPKPKWPSCEGPQFGRGPAGETYFDVHYDANGNEISADKPMHDNATPQHSASSGSASYYSDDFAHGTSNSYGVEVDSGKSKASVVGVHAAEASRGKES